MKNLEMNPHMKRALYQDDTNNDAVIRNGENALFTTDMIHGNPGLEQYESDYLNPFFLKGRNFDGKVFFLYDAAQYGLLWDKFDVAQGVVATDEASDDNKMKVFPYGSEARKWAEKEKARITNLYNTTKEAGLKVYFMMDTITLPVRLVELNPDVLTNNRIDILKPKTKEVMEYLFSEMFAEFPQIDGIYIRYGENYVGPEFNTPYHRGNNPIIGDDLAYHMHLINFLRDKMCEANYLTSKEGKFYDGGNAYKANWTGVLYNITPTPKELIYRTWGFGEFQKDKAEYIKISDKIEPHPYLYFCIKHVAGDFHRTIPFNQSINCGKHRQIIEVQTAREYEGKGAFPNYICDGVINGFEEYEWLMSKEENQSLRDVINTPDSNVKGIWTWTRGGGWNGPYITGINGKKGVHEGDNQEVVIKDGSELWDDLSSYVITQWAKDTSKTDKYYLKQYAKNVLGMNEKDAENLYLFCLKSARAVLLGRARGSNKYNINIWWTRDQNINTDDLINDIQNAVENGTTSYLLADKAECVQLWKEMIEIAQNFDDSVKMKDYIITTTKYGYYLFSIFEKLYKANILKVEGDKTGSYSSEIKQIIQEYEQLWAEWEELFKTSKGCPTLYAKEDKTFDLLGYNWNKGFDSAINPLRTL